MSSSKKNMVNRRQCFLCSAWQKEELMVWCMFNGIEELVCKACESMLQTREDSMETQYEHEEYKKKKEAGALERPSEGRDTDTQERPSEGESDPQSEE